MNTLTSKPVTLNHTAEKCFTNFEFTDAMQNGVKYIYKIKKQKERNSYSVYDIQISKTKESESGNTEIQNFPDRLTLYQNFIDNSGTYITIKFFLPKSAKTKIILLNSDKTEALYLINKNLKAGFHTLVTDIRNEELQSFEYYLELKAGRNSDVKKMKFISII